MYKYTVSVILAACILAGCQRANNESITTGIIHDYPEITPEIVDSAEAVKFHHVSDSIDEEMLASASSGDGAQFQYWLFRNADPDEGYVWNFRDGIQTIRYREFSSDQGLRMQSLRLYINNRISLFLRDATSGHWIYEHFFGSYVIYEEHGIIYIMAYWDDNTSERFLVLYGDRFISLHNANSEPFFHGEAFYHMPSWLNGANTDILSATSERREGDILHSTDNLDLRIGLGWSNGAPGNGVGEKIIFSHERHGYRMPFNVFFISTGFVCFDRPYLFGHYSRPRKVRVSFEGELPWIGELDDTPNFQRLGASWPPPRDSPMRRDLWIEILEVYPGTRSENVFINAFVWGFVQ